MSDATTRKLLGLLQADRPDEVRRAAAVVLGELGGRSAEVDRALCAALDDADAGVRSRATAAVAKLKVEPALPRLLERVGAGGAESEEAAHAAARLGAKGARALRGLMDHSAPGLRRRIAGALAAAGGASAETAALDALLDTDPGVVDASARSLIAKIPALDKAHRRSLVDRALGLLGGREAALSPPSETALVRLLAALRDPRAEDVFWTRLEETFPAEQRAAALQALGAMAVTPTGDRLRSLFASAADTDFRVAAPAIMILKAVPVDARTRDGWLGLLQAPDAAARRFAMEKLADQDTPAVAAALLPQLAHPDRGVRDQALHQLARMTNGRTALADGLLEAPNPDAAWSLARVQARLVRDYPPALREKIFRQACDYQEAGDRRADALLFLLREADPRELRDRLEEKALALRKKKDYAGALAFLRLLTRDPACGEDVRFEAAGCALKLSAKDVAADARASDPALHQFAGLIHRHETEPADKVEKAKWLDALDLFYLGFHFAEGTGPEKQFGSRILHSLVRRWPRSKQAKDAKSKLRREALD